jgi:heme/copper-type cytochrome/quinol oxidase subunit 3
MDWREAPKADTAMLVYLACVTVFFGLFAWSFYFLMQPTVLPNAGLSNYKEPGRTTVFLHRIDTSAERMESAAVAAAEQANKEQGIDALRAYASAPPRVAPAKRLAAVAASNRAAAKSSTRVATAVAKQPKQAKPRRLAVRREPARDRWGWDVASGSNNWFGSSGGRPFWSSGRDNY